MEYYVAKPTADLTIAKQFPGDGPGQFDVSKWVEEHGGKLNLYDGEVSQGIETSTGATWHWRSASLKDVKWVNIGEWIVKTGDVFSVMTNDEFESRFRSIAA